MTPNKSSHRRCSEKKLFFKISQYSQENICVGASACNFINKETPVFKRTYFVEHPQTKFIKLSKQFFYKTLVNICFCLVWLTLQLWLTETYLLRGKCSYLELFWFVFFRNRTAYGEILRISPYSVQMWENTDQKNSK